MTSISKFDSQIYSEEIAPVSEREYDEVMSLMADEDFSGYGEWSAAIEAPTVTAESENFRAYSDGRVEYKGAGLKSNGRVNGIEI